MKKKVVAVIVLGILIIFMAVIISYLIFTKNIVRAKVTNYSYNIKNYVIGTYDIELESGKKKIQINGYSNLEKIKELIPKDEECLNIPELKKDSKVEFNLPKISEKENTYGVCYKKKEKGYFFTRL